MKRFDWLLRRLKPVKRKRSAGRACRRGTYRPVVERLEDRTLLSTSSVFSLTPAPSNAALIASPSVSSTAPSVSPIVGLGVVGDSLSDEYSTYLLRSYATNWVALLAQHDGINVGPVGNYPEPRGHGYAYDWAQSGATSTTLLSTGQATGLAAQAKAGLVTDAVIMVGQDDFNPLLGTAYASIYSGLWSASQIKAYSNQVVANITTTLQELTSTPAKVVLSNIVDYGIAPDTQRFYSNTADRAKVSAVIDGIDSQLATLANTYHVPLIDLNGAAQFVTGSPESPKPSASIGGVTITNTTGIFPTDEFTLDDHPGTLLSAELANLVVTAFNLGYHTDAATFSEAQVVGFAGLKYGGTDTLHFNPSLYVHLPTVGNAPPSIGIVGTAPTQVMASQPLTTLVSAMDALINVVASDIGTANLSATNKVATLAANVTDKNGLANVELPSVTIDQQTATAKSTANGSLADSVTINVISRLLPLFHFDV